ncbi:OmpA family protein [Azohydromonas caseinilytica]|uniref:OmpA family protein n=1 Tax=Azohydromonas caseinilytica TaxID=2728836 RepID=A0A848F757_9BURK|nr:OmpA family protein [Azohydromonas caseinilytica]NML14998.1 OmpA family protein [Azohydromonas caseinilytica]
MKTRIAFLPVPGMTTSYLRQAALPLAVAGACLAIGLAAHAADATEPCSEQARGRFSDRCAADPRAREIDGVDHLPQSSERELPRLTVLLGDERAPQLQRSERQRAEAGAGVERSDRHAPRFASGEDLLREDDRARLDAVVAQVRGRPGLRFEIVGHTDVQRISPPLRARFPDNQALGLARARQVGRYLTQQLGLPESAALAASMGPDEPLATPARDRANWPANRRVEVRVYWQDPAPVKVVTEVVERRVDSTVCAALTPPDPADVPLRITVDGAPLDNAGMSSADHQRCTDVRLEQDRLRLQYDNLSAPRRLNATAWPATVVPGDTVHFAGYSNYRLYLAKAELRVFRADAALQPQLLATVPLDGELRAQWSVPADLLSAGVKGPSKLFYRLRVYDRAGRFDQTDDIPLSVAERHAAADNEPELTLEQRLLAAYGSSRLAVSNIPVRGGTVTASGEGIRKDQRVRALGFSVPVDLEGKFALQQLVPRQVSSGEIAVIDADGREQVYRRDFELPRQDFFLVGQADLTLGRNHTSGPAALVTGEKNRYQNDVWSEGRIAFYGKGQLDERWALTASVDTEERALKDLFRNLDRKDPGSLFRRIDPADSWGTFGDDSTTIEDAPTQGRMYLRVDDGRSHAMWGNFKLALGQDNTLAQVNRGLYGLHGRYVGEESTSFGDAALRLDLYGAEPGTLSAREEFRGTGGSLYYLRHQDVTRGAEKAYVEIRDRDSGLVLQRRLLVPGTDYEVDYLQGRLLLSAPLSSTADNGALLASLGGYRGQPTYLVVDYEYTPLGTLDTLAAGGRVAWWASENVRLGLTGARQRQTGGDQRLAGVDLLLRKSDASYLKLEAARSEGPGTTTLQSLDGGFNFGGALLTDSVAANAWRVEGQADLAELDLAAGGRVAAYAQQRGAGFSAPGQLATNETRQAGVTATLPVGERTEVRLKVDHKDEERGYDSDAAEVQASRRLDERWTLSAGVRADRKGTDALVTSPLLPTVGVVTGERTDAVVQLDHDSGQGWSLYGFGQKTLNRSGTRLDNDRLGLGGRYQVNDKLALNAQVSGGDGGGAGKAGIDYQVDDRSNVYLTYVRDTGRTDETLAARGGVLVGGIKSRVADGLSVYTEQRHSTGAQAGLVHAYGLQYAPDERWTFGLSAEKGRIEPENAGEIKREALGFSAGYVREGLRWAGGLETRRDASSLESRRSWLLKNAVSLKQGEDGRWLGKLNWADSDSNTGALAAAKYTEAVLGYAWRPVANDRLNMLFKYTYLYDLSSPGQLAPGVAGSGASGGTTSIGTLPVASGLGVDYQQRSQVLAVDATYELDARWSIGGKLARRVGELRPSRDDAAAWFKSTADLAIVRVDWKVVRQWDWMVELRTLRAAELDERKSGFLTALYYHVNENVKVGAGYNFTDFSDNLTDLSYRSRGVFLNVLGKF